MNWYLLQIKPNANAMACKNLEQQGFAFFCPFMIQAAKKNNKYFERKIPLFPGYLFMGTSRKPIPWNSINGTRGVSRVVTLDGKYHPVNIQIIRGLKDRCDEDGVVQQMSEIESGDRVKIKRGPFSDFICNVDEIADDKRAWVLIDLLQKQTRTQISLTDLSKVN